ncbi:hypothetical protein [Streptomyces sp. NPDC003393]
MRGLSARRIASTALCTAFLAAICGPAAMAAESARAHSRTAESRASLPDADRLLAELDGLGDLSRFGDLGSRLTPVRDLAAAVLTADNGRPAPAETEKLGTAAERALVEASEMIRSAQAPSGVPRAADPASDALAAVQKALEDLVKSLTSGDVGEVLPAVTSLVDGLVDLVNSLLQEYDSTSPGTSASGPLAAEAS